jgi:hypothetical protein
MVRRFTALVWIVAAAPAAAEPVSLSSGAIRDTVTGSVLELDTPLGTKISVHFSKDGRLLGEAGALAFYLGSTSDRGRWWIAGDQLCHKWTRWFDAEAHCLRLRKDGARLLWRQDDGNSGTATIASRSELASRPETPPFALGHQEAGQDKMERKSPPPLFAGAAVLPLRAHADVAPSPRAPAAPVAQTPPNVEETKQATAEVEQPSPPPNAGRAAEHPRDASKASRAEAPVKISSLTVRPSFRVTGVGGDDVLNVRSGPSSDHAAVGAIRADTRGVTIVGACIASWCPIRHRDIGGWVNSIYLAEER